MVARMKVLVDIEEGALRSLEELAKVDGRSRASMIREAIASYLAARRTLPAEAGFALWNADEDGLAMQERLRAEW